MIRFSPPRLALSYIALGVLALGLFAIPLWYSYRANLGTFRAYVPGAEMQRLVDIFHIDGPQAAAAAVESYLPSMPRDEVLIFVDPQKRRLAGSLPAWPAEVPDVPGTYGLVIGLGGDASMRVVTSHVALPGGYQLLMGRESVRFDSLVARFWYGIGGAVAIVLTLALAFAWLLRRERGQLEALVAQRTAALRLSEERYARAMEATEAGHWEWDLVANEVFHSARFRELYGVAPEEKFASRDEWKARQPVSRAERERQERALQAAIADPAKSYDIELFFEARPGEVRWLRSRGKVFRAGDGRPLRIAGATTDITAQKLAQEALRRSEERYARLMQASEDGFWEWVVASDEFYASPRMLALYDLPPDTVFRSREEFLARFPFHPEDLDLWRRAVAAHLAGETARIDIEVRAKLRSETRWIRLTAVCQRGASGAEERWTGSVSEVTDRRRAQEALRRSEERYAHAMEGSDAGHWDWNIVTDEMFVSERAREMLALPPGELPATRAEIMALVPQHPEDRLTMHEHVRVGIVTGNFERDYRVIPRPGEVRWLHSRAKVYKDARGAAVRMTGSLVDITERKRGADALKRSEERFALSVAGSNDGLWDWDIVTNEMFLSERAQRIYGLDPGPTIRPRAEWRAAVKIHPDDAEGQLRSVEDYLAGKSANYEGEWRVLHPDGRYRWIRIRGICVRDAEGRPTRFAGSVSDIDERRRAEEALRRSESYLTEALRLGRAGSFAYDVRAHRQVHWSRTTYEILDFDPAGGLPTPEEVYRRVHPDDVERVREARENAMSGKADYDAHYRIVRRDGTIRHLHATGHPALDANGEVVELIGVVTDITERKRAEEEVGRMERKLRQAQRLEAMGTLAGGIAHDFNNILGAILGYGEMALRDAPKGSRLRRDLDSIMTAGERGRALVDRVLAFSRSGVGERIAVPVEKVVREALDLVSAKLPPDVTLHAKLHAASAAMLGDPTQVHQVLMNLATNAVQAMPGGGTLRVSLETQHVDAARATTINSLAPADYVVLKVADTGTGIAPEILERIFDPFFTTKEVGTGTGLGLSLVHGIVSEVGGAIDVASKLGAGSTFTVYLPRSGDALDSFQREESELPRGGGQRVLIVDDEEPLVKLATRTLEELGYAPVGFTSSAAALAAFRADPQRFDALITDERMPGLSGSALIREVRGIRDGIPIVLMSGYVGGRIATTAREAGAEEVLKKPLSARDLAASLARVLAEAR